MTSRPEYQQRGQMPLSVSTSPSLRPVMRNKKKQSYKSIKQFGVPKGEEDKLEKALAYKGLKNKLFGGQSYDEDDDDLVQLDEPYESKSHPISKTRRTEDSTQHLKDQAKVEQPLQRLSYNRYISFLDNVTIDVPVNQVPGHRQRNNSGLGS